MLHPDWPPLVCCFSGQGWMMMARPKSSLRPMAALTLSLSFFPTEKKVGESARVMYHLHQLLFNGLPPPPP